MPMKIVGCRMATTQKGYSAMIEDFVLRECGEMRRITTKLSETDNGIREIYRNTRGSITEVIDVVLGNKNIYTQNAKGEVLMNGKDIIPVNSLETLDTSSTFQIIV